jgi:acetyl esterase/lipase
MPVMKFLPTCALLVVSLLLQSTASAEWGTTLWKDIAPFSKGNAGHDMPRIFPYLPEKSAAPTSAVVICPGGGYAGLAMQSEGTNVATYFQQHGVAAFVLVYRLPPDGYRHPVPLLDAQRAMRFVRGKAAEYHIDPAKVGIMGFSAGGHLAATLDTHNDPGNPQAPDPVDRLGCRPDFAVLVYAVISMKPGLTHQGSRDNLLGPNPDPALVENLSNEDQVTPKTPPTILFHAVDDTTVSIENSRLMYAALQKAGVPSALHEYPRGGHGFGVGVVPDLSPPGWMDTLLAWLKTQGFAK